jgi:hypothetical protein
VETLADTRFPIGELGLGWGLLEVDARVCLDFQVRDGIQLNGGVNTT